MRRAGTLPLHRIKGNRIDGRLQEKLWEGNTLVYRFTFLHFVLTPGNSFKA